MKNESRPGVYTAEALALAGGAAPVCECHGEPKVWHKGARYKAGGCWRCAVKKRGHIQRWREANPGKVREYERRHYWAHREKVLAAARRNYHRADGGYIQRRKRGLAAQRGSVEAALQELRKEAESLVSQP